MTKEERRKAAQRRQRIAWCIVIGIALAIFGLGVLCGVAIKGSAANLPEETTPPIMEEPTLAAETQALTKEPATMELVSLVEVEPPKVEPYYNLHIPLCPELQDYTLAMCEKYNVPFALALAIMDHESNFDPDAVSSTNDYGLMQINKVNFEALRAQGIEPLTYEGNIEAGCKIIGGHIERYGSIELALMAYNCGPTGARRLWDGGTYSTRYSRAVMDLYDAWQNVLEGKE